MRVKRFILPNSKIDVKQRIRIIISFLYSIIPIGYLLIGLHYLLKKKKNYKYEVSLCLLFKNEAPYLKEWLEYHLMIGVEHFYLYNNNSVDDFEEILYPYIQQGMVTLIEWPKLYSQVEAYQNCYKARKEESHWIGFIDADEFINISYEQGTIIKFLSKYKRYPSVTLFWKIFGTSGVMKEDPSKLVVENYTSCWPYLSNLGKYFLNNDYIFTAITVHWCKAMYWRLPLYSVASNKMFCPYLESFPRNISFDAYLNHYWSRSREWALYKTYHRSDAAGENWEITRKHNGLDFFELQCSDKDFSIQRWLAYLKERMKV